MKPLLIFGASTRAAAFSAIRAGFRPVCGDMFADADLRKFATVLDVPDYPFCLAAAANGLSEDVPWIYTGAMENWPAEVDRVSQQHPLWGNSGGVLRRCRDPWQIADALRQSGISPLELRSSDDPPPRDGNWIMKPLKSSAGRAIAVWEPQTVALSEPHCFQQRVSGQAISGAYVGTVDGVYPLGASLQLIGDERLHAPPFGYCGSVFPIPPRNTDRELQEALKRCTATLRKVGEVVHATFGLRGLFGIDFLFDGRDVWLTEVNPRYTASMELIEYHAQLPLLKLHHDACLGLPQARLLHTHATPGAQFVAKVILYADRNARAPDLTAQTPHQIRLDQLPTWADIPVPGTEIHPGQPVFSCLGEGDAADELTSRLIERAQDLWQTFPSL